MPEKIKTLLIILALALAIVAYYRAETGGTWTPLDGTYYDDEEFPAYTYESLEAKAAGEKLRPYC